MSMFAATNLKLHLPGSYKFDLELLFFNHNNEKEFLSKD